MPNDGPSAIERILTASDPWQALGLARGVDQAAVKTECRKLSLEVHPDKNPDDPLAVQEFIRLTKAYRVSKPAYL